MKVMEKEAERGNENEEGTKMIVCIEMRMV